MADLTIRKQNTPFGCFINCFGMLKSRFNEDYIFTEEDEFRLLEEAFRFNRECYEPYLISELAKDHSVEVFVESDYLHWKYKQLLEEQGSELEPEHKVLSSDDFKKSVRSGFAIVLLDKWHIDMYTHFAHWVLISNYTDQEFVINDSWTGREIRMPEERFMDSIKSLKQRLRCSPILIQIKE